MDPIATLYFQRAENKGSSFITGAVTGVGNAFKDYGLYALIVVLILVGSWFGINVLRARKNSSNQQTTPTEKETFKPRVRLNMS